MKLNISSRRRGCIDLARPSNTTVFLRVLKEQGGYAANPTLRGCLGWPEEKYWSVHQELYDAGVIARGRGRGGTVLLKTLEDEADLPEIIENLSDEDMQTAKEVLVEDDIESEGHVKESELYTPLEAEIVKFLKLRKGLRECGCQITASQGRRDTGGSWSRPDLIAVGVRVYEYLPSKSAELHTFEVKASYDVSVKGVLEALAHRESATHSHVIYHTDGRDWEQFPEARRIEQLAVRHGIGVIVATSAGNLDDWDELVTASRSNADPDIVDRVIGSLSENLKSKVRIWTR